MEISIKQIKKFLRRSLIFKLLKFNFYQLEHVNNIVAEKVKKYKEKIKKITENTGIKEIDLQNKINSLNEIIVIFNFF